MRDGSYSFAPVLGSPGLIGENARSQVPCGGRVHTCLTSLESSAQKSWGTPRT